MAADTHAAATTTDLPPISDAQLLADRQRFWQSFMRFVTFTIAGAAIVLLGLLVFVA